MVPRILTALLVASLANAAPLQRSLPLECGRVEAPRAEDAERAWNQHYATGFQSIEAVDLESAHASICRALADAASFDARDWRFAETLDELGLIDWLRGDRDGSVAAQAGAVAEMLLARGPAAPEVALYADRLAIPLGLQGRKELAAEIEAAPHRVLTSGLVSRDEAMDRRLDWLVSEYLRREDVVAARELQAIIDASDATSAPDSREEPPVRKQ